MDSPAQSVNGRIGAFLLDDHEVVRRGPHRPREHDLAVLFAAVIAGASGYVLKEIGRSSLTDAIRQVAAGRSLFDAAVTGKLLERLRNPPNRDPRLSAPTERDREILDLIADGLTNRQIAERLFLAKKAVKNYVSGLLTKLDMERRTQAAVYGADIRQGHAKQNRS